MQGADFMRFDYNFGTEATFVDWEQDGCDRARAILDSLNDTEISETSTTNEKD